MLRECFWHLRGTWDQSNESAGMVFRYAAYIFPNITIGEIQRPRMLVAQNIGQVSVVGLTYDWHNRCSTQKVILSIPPPFSRVHIMVDWITLRVSKVHWFKIEMHLQWEMCPKELDTFEDIPVKYCSEAM
jgi:hypothetical protein